MEAVERLAAVSIIVLLTTSGLASPLGATLLSADASTPAAPAYFRQSNGQLFLGNQFLEIGFNESANFTVSTLVNNVTGFDYGLHAGSTPLFTLHTRDSGMHPHDLLPDNFGSQSWAVTQASGDIALHMVWSSYQFSYAGSTTHLSVEATAEVNSTSPEVQWSINATNQGSNLALYSFTYPIIGGFTQFGVNQSADELVYPAYHDMLIRDPYSVLQAESNVQGSCACFPADYPTFNSAIQFLSVYNSQDGTGLYWMMKDTQGYQKSYGLSWNQGALQLYQVYYLPVTLGNGFSSPYSVSLGFFQGKTWYDAANIYRDWALKQWWATGKLADGQNAMANLGLNVFGMSYNPDGNEIVSYSEFASTARALKNDFPGVETSLAWVGWENCGAVTCWSQIFPPLKGEPALVYATSTINSYGVMAIPVAGSGDLMSENTTDFQRLSNAVVMNENLQPDTLRYNPPPSPLYAHMDVANPLWQAYLLNNSMMLKSTGFDAIYFDSTPYLDPNYDPDSGHQIGGGTYYIDAFWSLFTALRQEVGQGVPIITEVKNELLIPYVSAYTNLGTNFESVDLSQFPTSTWSMITSIPLFEYIYHEYIVPFPYGSFYDTTGLPELPQGMKTSYVASSDSTYWKTNVGRMFVWGGVPSIDGFWQGVSYSSFSQLPSWQIDFLYKLALARETYAKDFLVYGKMLSPPNVASIKLYPVAGDLGLVGNLVAQEGLPSVLDSAWQAQDGSVGYVFLNIAGQSQNFSIPIPKLFQNQVVYTVTDGLLQVASAGSSSQLTVTVGPDSVVVVVIADSSGARGQAALQLQGGFLTPLLFERTLNETGLDFTSAFAVFRQSQTLLTRGEPSAAASLSANATLDSVLELYGAEEFTGYNVRPLAPLLKSAIASFDSRDYRQFYLASMETIGRLLNATKPHILVDELHGDDTLNHSKAASINPSAPFSVYLGGLANFTLLYGYDVSSLTTGTLTSTALSSASILMIPSPRAKPFTQNETSALLAFVKGGGSLMITLSSVGSSVDPSIWNPILSQFGMTIIGQPVLATDHLWAPGVFDVTDFDQNGPAVRGVTSLISDWGVALRTSGNATIVAFTPSDSYTQNPNLNGPFPFIVLDNYGRGRVMVVATDSVLKTYDNSSMRYLFLNQAVNWLVGTNMSALFKTRSTELASLIATASANLSVAEGANFKSPQAISLLQRASSTFSQVSISMSQFNYTHAQLYANEALGLVSAAYQAETALSQTSTSATVSSTGMETTTSGPTTSTTSSASSVTSGGGIPELPFQLVAVTVFTSLVVAAYALSRSKLGRHGNL